MTISLLEGSQIRRPSVSTEEQKAIFFKEKCTQEIMQTGMTHSSLNPRLKSRISKRLKNFSYNIKSQTNPLKDPFEPYKKMDYNFNYLFKGDENNELHKKSRDLLDKQHSIIF